MASQLATSTNKVQKFFDDLEARRSIISTCTQVFTNLSKHFSSLEASISQKSQLIDSNFEALESHANKTHESLDHRENSIPERESAAAARIEEQKEAALADFAKPIPANVELSETLKSLCRKMDSSALLRFIVSRRKESASLRAEIVQAIAEAVDPPRLVLDAVEEFLNSKSAKSGVTDKRWACGILIQALFPETSSAGKSPEFCRRMVGRAADLIELWKGQMDGISEDGAVGAAEAVMFLQMVVGFRLRRSFDEEYLRKMVMEFASRRDMAKIASALEFGENMGDIIDELVKNGKEVEAVYFASESGLTERFPPINLLKSYLRNFKKNATTLSKSGNHSQAALDESSTLELNSIKAAIKCIEDHKLESEFNLDSLRKRVAHLEKSKAERKKSSFVGNKSHKRAYGSSSGRGVGSSSFRPAKAAKFNSYPSLNRRNPPAPPQPSPVSRFSGSFNYPSQTVYDGPTANPYAAAYGAPHSQSPVGLTQHHYSLPSASFGAQTNYGIYDYGNAAPPAYQPPFTH
ncbi:FRIGIDA-like protein 4a [Neltuma alba]|uniref:FRIGIDA-like protein 4a n=1 Tax=Neltuma alba TaxID=207710 RepID=UPI0010A38088|nr:FRIGIDA-like protein 4a [Prosopis alba]XP_028758192.1 FRIGIDA-like protein 4a [Prosopis alba]